MIRRPSRRKTITLMMSAVLSAAIVLIGVPAPASAVTGGRALDWETEAGGMVSINVDYPAGSCSGALISRTPGDRNSKLVLTARHCFEDDAGNLVTAVNQVHVYNGSSTGGYGSHYGVNQMTTVYVDTDRTDTVILQLTDHVSGSLAFPYNTTSAYPTGTGVRVNGYGYNDTAGNTRYLRQGDFTITKTADLTHSWYVGNGAMVCSGDSGGPVIDQNGVIIGTVDTGTTIPGQTAPQSCTVANSNSPLLSFSKLHNSNLDYWVGIFQ
ncbi:trypsin-like serine protease [Embleya sp. AB8]|uniref:trypsin-like serine protease n=1 Tax=Embleya sp. AB8 TaxID=3156304 RepID=UPI003C780F27